MIYIPHYSEYELGGKHWVCQWIRSDSFCLGLQGLVGGTNTGTIQCAVMNAITETRSIVLGAFKVSLWVPGEASHKRGCGCWGLSRSSGQGRTWQSKPGVLQQVCVREWWKPRRVWEIHADDAVGGQLQGSGKRLICCRGPSTRLWTWRFMQFISTKKSGSSLG